MRYRTLGQTGLRVSVVGFGASPLGNVFGAVSLDEGARAVGHAIDHGINIFDVSPYYGETEAETRLGDALQGKRQEILLATKCGRYGVNHFDFSATTIRKGLEDSLRRLKTDSVDILQAHDVEFANNEALLNETLPEMRRLQSEGKARYIGITGYWPGFLAEMASRFAVDTVLNYCHANLFADDMDERLTPAARSLDFGLMNASPLHMGLLSGKEAPSWHPAPENLRRTAEDVRALCMDHDADAAQIALRHCLEHPVVACTFVGMSSASEVDAALSAVGTPTPPDLLAMIAERVHPVRNMSWVSGLPENADSMRAIP